jgi:twinkle protein
VPSVFNISGGAMWNNKMDNIMIYHRPNWHIDPSDRSCELYIRKVRRQKIIGIPGDITFEYSRQQRRFTFNDFPLLNYSLGATITEQPYVMPPNPLVDFTEPKKEPYDDWSEKPPF